MRQTLYLKYRPSHFKDLVGQEVVARTLGNAVRDARLSHAYLFSGIRGTGKTSAARILARAINCDQPLDGEPCDQCASCQEIAAGRSMDVIEMDAATNGGVDEIRDLRERAQFLPSRARLKVYIIDEAHMLSTPAGNAFLKSLEEPPPHACFILATTEPQRLPETVLSRCQRFEFRRIPLEAMARHLGSICQQEGVTTEPGAMELVAEAAAGSLRDAISLLDRMIGLAPSGLDQETVQHALGLADPKATDRLAAALASGQAALAWRELQSLQAGGADPRQLMRSLGTSARKRHWELMKQNLDGAADGFWLELMATCAGAAAELRRADDPWMSLEATLLQLARPTVAAPPATSSPAEVVGQPASARRQTEPMPASASSSSAAAVSRPNAPVEEGEPAPLRKHWAAILESIRPHSPHVHALLRDGKPTSFEDRVLVVAIDWEWHYQQMQQPRNRQILLEACQRRLGEPVTLRLVQSEARNPKTPKEQGPSVVSAALKVFPGSKVTKIGSPDR